MLNALKSYDLVLYNVVSNLAVVKAVKWICDLLSIMQMH